MEAKHNQVKQSRRNQTLISGTSCPQPVCIQTSAEARSLRDTPGPLFAEVVVSENRHFQDAAAL